MQAFYVIIKIMKDLGYKIIFVIGAIGALLTGGVLGRFLMEDAFQAYPGMEGTKLLSCLCNKDLSAFTLPLVFFTVVTVIGLISTVKERFYHP